MVAQTQKLFFMHYLSLINGVIIRYEKGSVDEPASDNHNTVIKECSIHTPGRFKLNQTNQNLTFEKVDRIKFGEELVVASWEIS